VSARKETGTFTYAFELQNVIEMSYLRGRKPELFYLRVFKLQNVIEMSCLHFKVMTSSLSYEEVSYEEDSNIWIGPRLVCSLYILVTRKHSESSNLCNDENH